MATKPNSAYSGREGTPCEDLLCMEIGQDKVYVHKNLATIFNEEPETLNNLAQLLRIPGYHNWTTKSDAIFLSSSRIMEGRGGISCFDVKELDTRFITDDDGLGRIVIGGRITNESGLVQDKALLIYTNPPLES